MWLTALVAVLSGSQSLLDSPMSLVTQESGNCSLFAIGGLKVELECLQFGLIPHQNLMMDPSSALVSSCWAFETVSLVMCSYRVIARLVQGPATSDQIVGWARTAVDKWHARAMLYLALYYESFVARGCPCESALEALQQVQFRQYLFMTEDEAKSFLMVASGPHDRAVSANDGLVFLFSSQAFQEREGT